MQPSRPALSLLFCSGESMNWLLILIEVVIAIGTLRLLHQVALFSRSPATFCRAYRRSEYSATDGFQIAEFDRTGRLIPCRPESVAR